MRYCVQRILENSRETAVHRRGTNGDRSTGTETGSANAGVVRQDRGMSEQRNGCKGVVQITGNRSHDLLPLGEAIHHRGNPAPQPPSTHASRDAHANQPGCSADWGYGHLFDALIWAVILLSVLYALYRGFIHSLLNQAARSGSCVHRHGTV